MRSSPPRFITDAPAVEPKTETERAPAAELLRTDVVRGDAARERFSTGSTEDDLAEQSLEPAPQAAPRPEGAYPRSIEHQERVEYSYNPSTEEFAARVVSSSKPVVTDWDYSPPQQDEREVGTWDVTPTEDGVTAQNQGRVEVPENVKERLRAEADETGEAVSTTITLRYQHDLDTRATQSRVPRPSVAERAAALRERSQRQGQKDGELSPQYQKILEKLTQQREQKTQQRRRSSSNRLKESQGYSLPQIVVVQEAAPSTRRFGGL